jgi:hypothetical protein
MIPYWIIAFRDDPIYTIVELSIVAGIGFYCFGKLWGWWK